MNIPRLFASAFIRKVAYVLAGLLVYAVLSFVGIGKAHAEIITPWTCTTSCFDKHSTSIEAAEHAAQQAQEHVQAWCDAKTDTASINWEFDYANVGAVGNAAQRASGGSGRYQEVGGCRDSIGPPDTTLYHASVLHYHDYQYNTCVTQPDRTDWMGPSFSDPPNPSGIVCDKGCEYQGADVCIDTGTSCYVATGSTCSQNSTNSPDVVGDTDGDGIPDTDDDFPDDPNEDSDSDGDGTGDNSDTDPDDPTNGGDDGDGTEGDNAASGGATCSQPPACSGDAIACNTNWQIWKLRCTSGSVTGDPTVCAAAYTCTGDTAQCALVALARKSACAGAVGGTPGSAPGDANGNGVPDVVEGDGTGYTPGEIPSDFITEDDGEGAMDGVDQGGWLGGGGSCPGFPALTLNGQTYVLDEIPCEHAGLVRAVLLIFALVIAARIIGAGAAGV